MASQAWSRNHARQVHGFLAVSRAQGVEDLQVDLVVDRVDGRRVALNSVAGFVIKILRHFQSTLECANIDRNKAIAIAVVKA